MITSPRGEARAFEASSFRLARRSGTAYSDADACADAKRGVGDLEEFERELNERLAEAEARARKEGRADLLAYLSLRAANDRLRERGVIWLNESFEALAGAANRAGAGLAITREADHRFQAGHTTMVGTRLVLSRGVRSLTIEAGWPRSPRDGVVRGQALAYARVSHFGERASGRELLLVLDERGAPLWLTAEDGKPRAEFSEADLRRHLSRLLL